MKKSVYEDHQQLSQAVAIKIAAWIKEHPGSLLCLAAGDTPLQVFRQLVKMQNEGQVNLNSVSYVGLDEWVGLGKEDAGSCKQVMEDNFYAPAAISAGNRKVFDGRAEPEAECRRISSWIEQHNGIGLTLLGVGMNGHVGFNEPGTQIDDICGTIDLDEITLTVGSKYFDHKEVPGQGITISLQTLKKAKKIILMLSGVRKSSILKKILDGAPNLPAGKLLDHPDIEICCDKKALPQ